MTGLAYTRNLSASEHVFLFAHPLQEKFYKRQVLLLSYIVNGMFTLDCEGMACRQTLGVLTE